MASAGRWVAFTGGVAVGLAAGLLGGGAPSSRRRRSQRSGRAAEARSPQTPVVYPPPGDAEIDEELAQTFPASDPLPYSHRVD